MMENDKSSLQSNLITTNFVDFGLVSGTLWRFSSNSHNVWNCCCNENIPTRMQWDELCRECKFEYERDKEYNDCYYITITGPNGTAVKFRSHDGFHHSIWIKDFESPRQATCGDLLQQYPPITTMQCFKGKSLMVAFVK